MSNINLQTGHGSHHHTHFDTPLELALENLKADCLQMLQSYYAGQPMDDSKFLSDYGTGYNDLKALIASGQGLPTDPNKLKDFELNFTCLDGKDGVTAGNVRNLDAELGAGQQMAADGIIEQEIAPEILQMLKDLS